MYMRALFIDLDGTLTDDKMITYELSHSKDSNKHSFFPYDDKLIILKQIVDKYDLKVVINASCKIGYIENDPEFDYEMDRFIEELKKYNIPVIGYTPCVPNPVETFGSSMWKEYDIQVYLNEHPEVTEYVILDDHREHDLYTLESHLVQTSYDEDGLGNGGLLPHHVEEIKDKLKPREHCIPEEMEENELYKKIKYSEFNVVDHGERGLTISREDFCITIILTFDKKTILYHRTDTVDRESVCGVLNTYEDFLDILRHFNVIEKKPEDIKKLLRRC